MPECGTCHGGPPEKAGGEHRCYARWLAAAAEKSRATTSLVASVSSRFETTR